MSVASNQAKGGGSWIAAILLGLIGIPLIPFVVGFFVIAAGVVVSPPVHRKLQNRAAARGKQYGVGEAAIMALAIGVGVPVTLAISGVMLLLLAAKTVPAPAPKTEAKPQAASPAQPKPTAKPAKKDEPDQRSQEQVQSVWSRLTAATQPCDEANQRMAKALEQVGGGGSRYYAYDVAKWASQVCWNAASAIPTATDLTSLSGSERGEFKDALKRCRQAYILRSTSLNEMASVLDGDFRPSKVGTVKALSDNATQETLACVVGLESAADHAGVTLDEKPKEKSSTR